MERRIGGRSLLFPKGIIWAKCDFKWANFFPILWTRLGCLMRATYLSLQSFYFGAISIGAPPQISWSSLTQAPPTCGCCPPTARSRPAVSTPPSLPPLSGRGSVQIEHRLILLSPEFLLHKHYLFLLKLGTSGRLAFGLRFRSADSSGKRQQTQTEASIPFYFVFSLSSLPWAGMPGIFEEIHPSGMVGWREFWQCMLSMGTGFAVANIVCLQHKIAEAEALSHLWSDDPRLSRVSCLQVFWELMIDTSISSSYSHSQ